MPERRDPAPFDLTADLYAAHWPGHVPAERLTVEGRIERVRREFVEAGVFRLTDVGRWPWTARHDADGFVDVLNTFSNHVTLAPDVRSGFLAAVRERIAELGGIVEREHESVAMIARPKDDAPETDLWTRS